MTDYPCGMRPTVFRRITVVGSANAVRAVPSAPVNQRVVAVNLGNLVLQITPEPNEINLPGQAGPPAGSFTLGVGVSQAFTVAPHEGLFVGVPGAGGNGVLGVIISEAVFDCCDHI